MRSKQTRARLEENDTLSTDGGARLLVAALVDNEKYESNSREEEGHSLPRRERITGTRRR